jgi:serum/glucocorticoid-regulated kinase 2
MIERIDKLNFEDNSVIKEKIGDESIYYSDKIQKKKNGLISKIQERNFLITDQAIYNFKGNELKRRIKIENLKGITVSKLSTQFILHGNKNEYDYLLLTQDAQDRKKIINMIQTVYNILTHKDLLFSIKNEKDLSKLVVEKKDRKKNPNTYKIEKKELMSIREFIDSDGSLSINTHPNSQKLEDEFKKDNKYKEGISFEHFEIISLIGRGNTANIYLANYEGEMVALKVIDKAYIYQMEMIDKILLEKNILSSFSDEKFLCHMKFFFMTNTKICFVLPFYPGGDLFTMLENKGPFDEATAGFYGAQVAHMISFLHSKNIVYRDLKLENLMVNENGYLVLIDFGSCKVIEEKTELQCSFDGSIDYMAPEVISGDGHGMMADWWSFGILIYELLCGKPPFHEGSTERILDLITTSNIRFPSKMRVSSVTRDFIVRLLKKNPKERIGQNEFQQIVTHHFFQGSNVNSVINQKYSPPLTPNISGDPLANFESIYTNQGIEDFNASYDSGILDQIGNEFEDFKS